MSASANIICRNRDPRFSGPWRLWGFVAASMTLHALVLLQNRFPQLANGRLPKNDIAPLEIRLQPLETPRANTLAPKPVPSVAAQQRMPRRQAEERAPQEVIIEAPVVQSDAQISAQQLLQRSRDAIRSRSFEAETQYPGQPRAAPGLEYLTTDAGPDRMELVESYALPNGRKKVMLRSPSGRVQCFEVPEDDPLEVFSIKTWMFSHC